jgi:hypothetical protein
MRGYKFTTKQDCSLKGDMQWGENVTHIESGSGGICEAGHIHFYSDPLLAVLMDPIQGNFGDTAHMWECEVDGDVITDHGGLKHAATHLTTIKRVKLPVVTLEQRVRVAILWAKAVCSDTQWNRWADNWLSGKDQTADAAAAAAHAMWARADAAARAAADAAIRARADAAAAAAHAAVTVADAAEDADAWAADAAAAAAHAAVTVADADIDLAALARRAIEDSLETIHRRL